MPKSDNQKLKILYILDYLQKTPMSILRYAPES